MSLSLLGVYHRLPYPLRRVAATVHGRRLRTWRYSAETPRLVDEALERDTWDEATWEAYRRRRLEHLLDRAATRVPFYRERWKGATPRDWRHLERWPVLDKESVRREPRAFLADDCDPKRMYREQTSGSTGTPLSLWWSRATAVAWYALVEARLRRWHGVDRTTRWAILGGQLVAAPGQRRPPYWVWNGALSQLYLSAYHLTPETVASYLEALARHRVEYLFGYASALDALARLALEGSHPAPAMKVALSNAEPLLEHQRHSISRAFGCPVRDSYGLAELAVAGSECEEGTLHLWPEVGLVEVLPDGAGDGAEPLPESRARGLSGELVATGLLNADMPLIRYRTGDRGTFPATAEPCACGRTLPVLEAVEGRLDDVLVTPDGRRIGRLDPVFKADLPLREAQIVQQAPDRVVVRVVPAPGFDDEDAADILERLGARLGPAVTTSLERVEALPRGANGKLRTVVSEVPADVATTGVGAP